MPQEPTAIEQAVSRAIRDNLERIQRHTDELNQAVNDVVAACASSKPANALAPMLRAQATAASVAASLEVLSRFVAVTMQSGPRSPLEAEISRLSSVVAAESAAVATQPEKKEKPAHQALSEASATAPAREKVEAPVAESVPSLATPLEHQPESVETRKSEKLSPDTVAPLNSAAQPALSEPPKPAVSETQSSRKKTDVQPPQKGVSKHEPEPVNLQPSPEDAEASGASDFDVNRLSPEEQELHRRANRVAKVSMQDIKMLRPEQVRLGREKKDLCIRLRDDIEKAHREYDRRFRPIMDHPVDYFYRWMVEILADGDVHALGEYPYAIHANQR